MSDKSIVDYKFKIALIGDTNVGKSALLRRLTEKDEFEQTDINNNYIPNTVGVDFKRENFILDQSNINVSLAMYDTSGDEKYRLITLSYIENVQAFIIAYDVTNIESFHNCQYWLQEITKSHNCSKNTKRKKCDSKCKHLIKVLVGCKNDTDDTRHAVPAKKARDFAKRNGFCLFFETSSKDNLNIKELFEELSMELISNYISFLNYQENLLNLVSIPSTNRNFMQSMNTIPLNAMTTKSDIYFNCNAEKLNYEETTIFKATIKL